MRRALTPTRALRAHHDLSPGEIDSLERRLYAFNADRTGYHDAVGLGFVVEDNGDLIGAVAGYTWGGICEIRQVWVEETHRGQGIGRQLMQAALREAGARGCAYVYLATYEFQAPEFYRRLGFAELARVTDKPVGHTEIIMRHSLRPGG